MTTMKAQLKRIQKSRILIIFNFKQKTMKRGVQNILNRMVFYTLFLTCSIMGYSQEGSNVEIEDVTITLASGEVINAAAEDHSGISFNVDFTSVYYKAYDSKKGKTYMAKKIKELKYYVGPTKVILHPYEVTGGSIILLESVYQAGSVSLYRSPMIKGGAYWYYLSKNNDGFVQLMGQKPKEINELLGCEPVKTKFGDGEKNLSESELKQVVDIFQQSCLPK